MASAKRAATGIQGFDGFRPEGPTVIVTDGVYIALQGSPSLCRITRGRVLRFATPLPLATISSHLRCWLSCSDPRCLAFFFGPLVPGSLLRTFGAYHRTSVPHFGLFLKDLLHVKRIRELLYVAVRSGDGEFQCVPAAGNLLARDRDGN